MRYCERQSSNVTQSVKLRPRDGGSRSEDRFARPQVSDFVREQRVERLLEMIRQLEEGEHRVPESEFHDLLDDAIVACGFADELDAMRAILEVFGNELWVTE